jgi:uncharacterized membrane protein YfcA
MAHLVSGQELSLHIFGAVLAGSIDSGSWRYAGTDNNVMMSSSSGRRATHMIFSSMPCVSLSQLLCLSAISLLAGMAKGVSGFGAALIMAPLFGLFLPATEVGAMIVLLHAATSLQGMTCWLGLVRWKAVVPLALVALACTVLTLQLVVAGDNVCLHHVIGLAVLAVTALRLHGWRWRHEAGIAPTLVAGMISGVMTALGGIGGVPAVYYFSGCCKEGAALRANLLGYFAVLFWGASLILGMRGQLYGNVLTSALLLPAFAGGAWIGGRLCQRLPTRVVNHLVTGLLLVSGLSSLLH